MDLAHTHILKEKNRKKKPFETAKEMWIEIGYFYKKETVLIFLGTIMI